MNITGEIQSHLGEGDYAKLRFSESKEAFSIDTVFVPSMARSAGVGSILVQRILYMADCCGKKIFLTARPIGRTDYETVARLVRFYEQFGFKVFDEGHQSAQMVRLPHGEPEESTKALRANLL